MRLLERASAQLATVARAHLLDQALRPAPHLASIISRVVDQLKGRPYACLHLRIESEMATICRQHHSDGCFIGAEQIHTRLASLVGAKQKLYVAVGKGPQVDDALRLLGSSYDIVNKVRLLRDVSV